MRKIGEIKIGHVYGNGKGICRKVLRFTDTLGKEVKEPLNVWYVRWDENGAVKVNAKKQMCWVSTFIAWSKENVGNVGS